MHKIIAIITISLFLSGCSTKKPKERPIETPIMSTTQPATPTPTHEEPPTLPNPTEKRLDEGFQAITPVELELQCETKEFPAGIAPSCETPSEKKVTETVTAKLTVKHSQKDEGGHPYTLEFFENGKKIAIPDMPQPPFGYYNIGNEWVGPKIVFIDKNNIYVDVSGGIFEGVPHTFFFSGEKWQNLEDRIWEYTKGRFNERAPMPFWVTLDKEHYLAEEINYCCDTLHDFDDVNRHTYRKTFLINRKTGKIIQEGRRFRHDPETGQRL